MFKVLIVDDEQYIRKGIADHVDWKQLGCEVVGLAADGEEAFEIVEQEQPHVIITDIMMPIMSGLELIKLVKEKYPETYIIIISGYDEFDYVQQALKLGAIDYILKPVDLDYLAEYINGIKADYYEKIKKEQEFSGLKDIIAESSPVIKEQIMRDIVYERIPVEDGVALLKKYGYVFNGLYHTIFIAQVDDYVVDGEEGSRQREEFNSFHVEFSKGRLKNLDDVILFDKSNGQLAFYISTSSRLKLKDRVKEICGWLMHDAKDMMNKTLTIAVGSLVDTLAQLADVFRMSREALGYKFILGKNRIITEEDVLNLRKSNGIEKYDDFDDKDLVSSVKFADKDLIKDSLDTLADKIREKGKNSYIYTNMIVGSIFRHALRVLEEAGGSADDVFPDPIGAYTTIISQETINGMINELHNALLSISSYKSGMLLGKTAQIERAKDFILNNYSDSELSLESVAKYVNMSISYFSNNFKSVTNMTFVDFLTHIRIEKAKELLREGYMSYEVSELVGYNNSTYFSTVFKRVVGTTPSKFH